MGQSTNGREFDKSVGDIVCGVESVVHQDARYHATELIRIHGAFMSDDEVVRVVDDWKARGKPNYIDGILDGNDENESDSEPNLDRSGEIDELFDEVVDFVVSTGTTSISAIQRRFRVGFNRAANIMDQLEEQGIVSAAQNGKREVLARSSEY